MSAFSNSAITLKYWNGRGLMEVPRMILAIAGKFPNTDYTDGRYSVPDGDLTANLGRMPLAIVGDASIGQSAAINYYLATECGLMGKSSLEAAQIISISEHLKEMNTAYRAIVPWGADPSKESLDKWFDQGATDVTGTADRAGQPTRYLTWWMGRIEAVLGSCGFAVGDSLSLADVLLYNVFSEHLKDSECSPELPASRREAFCDKARTDAALEKYPKLKACCEAVAKNDNLVKYLSSRGVQMF